MKKSFALLLVVFISIVAFSSCKSTESCPAYGQANPKAPTTQHS